MFSDDFHPMVISPSVTQSLQKVKLNSIVEEEDLSSLASTIAEVGIVISLDTDPNPPSVQRVGRSTATSRPYDPPISALTELRSLNHL